MLLENIGSIQYFAPTFACHRLVVHILYTWLELIGGWGVFPLSSENPPSNEMPKGGFLLYNVVFIFQDSKVPSPQICSK